MLRMRREAVGRGKHYSGWRGVVEGALGIVDAGGTTVFVSRGVGGVEVPFRAWAPPDVGVFEVG